MPSPSSTRPHLVIAALLATLLLLFSRSHLRAAEKPAPASNSPTEQTLRVASVQTKRRVVDWHLTNPKDVLAAVDQHLSELESLVHQAGEKKCDALAFPEDTLGLLNWIGVNEHLAPDVLPQAVDRMLKRLGSAAASHNMYLVVCSDYLESDGAVYNTSFLLDRSGHEIGRYHKVCPTWTECVGRNRGDALPIFPTKDLGNVGMLICYDLVIPETARCLALAGADIIFFPTMGGAAIGDDDIGLQALRVRAAENQVYLVVAFRGSGSMIISPQGKILSQAEGPDGFAIADIATQAPRPGGDALNSLPDIRARLVRERNPAAFKILTDPHPPALDRYPLDASQQDAGRIAARTLTIGDEQFKHADSLIKSGELDQAISAFVKLRQEYPGTWIDRVSKQRLESLRNKKSPTP